MEILEYLLSFTVADSPKMYPPAFINTVAGNNGLGYAGDNLLATSTGVMLNYPQAVALDKMDDLYISDTNNHRVRVVSASTGIISTIAGMGSIGSTGDGGPATSAYFNYPVGVTVDYSGNIYITDNHNCKVRRVNALSRILVRYAGTGVCGYSGDRAFATSAQLNFPNGIVVDASGNVYVADVNNNRIRYISVATTIIITIVGTGTAGTSANLVQATAAMIKSPWYVALDESGYLYVADTGNHIVRRVDLTSGSISTIAGTGVAGYNGDSLSATSTQLNTPFGIAIDRYGTIYIASYGSNRVQYIPGSANSNAIMYRFTGNGYAGYSGDGNDRKYAEVNSPSGLAVDNVGNLYIADTNNGAVRIVESKSN